MERMLFEASVRGDTHTLDKLIQEDPLILDRATVTNFNETPLHIAALRGHLDFTKALLSLKPKLATELDSQGRSPLHLASAEGYTDIGGELLRVCTNVCLLRDHEWRIPLHLAAMKGRAEVIDMLIQACPESTKVRLNQEETVLHLCVKYNQLEALKKLMESVWVEDELIGSVEKDGNTILHVAVNLKQMETVKYLLSSSRGVKEKANALNRNGFTALDVLEHCQCMMIRDILIKSGVSRANDLNTLSPQPPPTPVHDSTTPPPTTPHQHFIKKCWVKFMNSPTNALAEEKARDNLLVPAVFIATVAFQAVMSPPGGFWQGSDATDGYIPGTVVLGDKLPYWYSSFVSYNNISFLASVCIILLTICGFPLKNEWFMWLFMVTMSLAVVFMILTYMAAVIITTTVWKWGQHPLMYFTDKLFGWCAFVIIIIVVMMHSAQLLKLILKFVQKIGRPRKFVPKNRWLLPSTTSADR